MSSYVYELELYTYSQESQLYLEQHHKEHGQEAKGVHSTQFYSAETPPGVLHLALESSAERRQWVQIRDTEMIRGLEHPSSEEGRES